jgi:hypothetical protein
LPTCRHCNEETYPRLESFETEDLPENKGKNVLGNITKDIVLKVTPEVVENDNQEIVQEPIQEVAHDILETSAAPEQINTDMADLTTTSQPSNAGGNNSNISCYR